MNDILEKLVGDIGPGRLTTFYVSRNYVKTRTEADELTQRYCRRNGYSGFNRITRRTNNRFVSKLITSQVNLDLMNGRDGYYWIYVLQSGFDLTKRTVPVK